jgi:hypothetical protein
MTPSGAMSTLSTNSITRNINVSGSGITKVEMQMVMELPEVVVWGFH